VDAEIQEDIIDPAAIERLQRIGGTSFVCDMIDLFMGYVPGRLAEARAALARADLPGVAKCVHPVRSSSGNVGARRMMALATTLERLATAAEPAELPDLMNRIEAEHARVMLTLAELRRKRSA
jgi:HPt (histidine-containing phosphotransfer) domain-containing protein